MASKTLSSTRRDLFRLGGALALGWGAQAAIGGDAPRAKSMPAGAVDAESLVHPDLRPMLPQLRERATKMPPLSDASLADQRKGMEAWAQPRLGTIPVEERAIDVPGSPSGVKLYIVNAQPGGSRPVIVHTHGGGFVSGRAALDVRNLQEVARELDCIGVTIDYRLAPEARWQASTADNYAGLKWVYDHAAEIGVDRSRIALMGESAGGGHAALLAINARDRGEVPVALQVLIYPMLDDRTGSSRAVPAHIGALGWSPAENRYGWRSFLGAEPGRRSAPYGSVPARVEDLRGLPPTFVGVGAIDLFVGEDIAFANRLLEAGVPTELVVMPGAFHGFDLMAPQSSIARQFATAKLNALRRAFGQPVTA